MISLGREPNVWHTSIPLRKCERCNVKPMAHVIRDENLKPHFVCDECVDRSDYLEFCEVTPCELDHTLVSTAECSGEECHRAATHDWGGGDIFCCSCA